MIDSYLGICSYLGAMEMSRKEIERRMARFEEVCKKAGVKITHQRMEIYREVARTGDHPDADSVFQRVKERIPTISLDTVYRALWLLSDLGLIKTLAFLRARSRFDANLDRHHHFVCVRCGLARDFYSESLDDLKLPRSVNELGYVETTRVEVQGICQACQKAVKKQRRITKGGEL